MRHFFEETVRKFKHLILIHESANSVKSLALVHVHYNNTDVQFKCQINTDCRFALATFLYSLRVLIEML